MILTGSAFQRVTILAATLAGTSASAVAASEEASGSLVSAALQTIVGLIVVLALIVGVAFFAKRFAPGRFGGANVLKQVASLPVGAREKVVIVELGDQWLVLGVTPVNINALHTVPKGQLPAPPSGTEKVAFADWLQRAKKKTPNGSPDVS